MRYSEGDIIKVDVSEQSLPNNFVLHCPYVEVTADYDSDDRGISVVWGKANLLDAHEDVLLRAQPYFFESAGSVLVDGNA